jgi:hypothetical protein
MEFIGIKCYKHKSSLSGMCLLLDHDKRVLDQIYCNVDTKEVVSKKNYVIRSWLTYSTFLDYIKAGILVECDTPINNNSCNHEFVNVGFTSLKFVCRKCNMEKTNGT